MSEIINKKWKEVRLADLSVRYIPVVTPIDLWNHDMSLKNSPHVELMRLFKKHGLNWGKIEKTRYYKERQHRHIIGTKRWTRNYIYYHIEKRYKLFKGIKKKYKSNKKFPIHVLKKPFWATRFGLKEDWLDGLELWNGAGRTSSLYVLGKKTVKVMMCKDKHPGTGKKGKFEKKLKGIKGVWPEKFVDSWIFRVDDLKGGKDEH